MIKNIAIIITVVLMGLDILQLTKDLKAPHYDVGKMFIPVWIQKVIPFIVSFCGYGLIIYAIIL